MPLRLNEAFNILSKRVYMGAPVKVGSVAYKR